MANEKIIREVWEVLESRRDNPIDSYTSKIMQDSDKKAEDKILEKVAEEEEIEDTEEEEIEIVDDEEVTEEDAEVTDAYTVDEMIAQLQEKKNTRFQMLCNSLTFLHR